MIVFEDGYWIWFNGHSEGDLIEWHGCWKLYNVSPSSGAHPIESGDVPIMRANPMDAVDDGREAGIARVRELLKIQNRHTRLMR